MKNAELLLQFNLMLTYWSYKFLRRLHIRQLNQLLFFAKIRRFFENPNISAKNLLNKIPT